MSQIPCQLIYLYAYCYYWSCQFIFRASFMTKTVQYQNELHKFLIWDTAGQERVNSNNQYTHWGDTYTSWQPLNTMFTLFHVFAVSLLFRQGAVLHALLLCASMCLRERGVNDIGSGLVFFMYLYMLYIFTLFSPKTLYYVRQNSWSVWVTSHSLRCLSPLKTWGCLEYDLLLCLSVMLCDAKCRMPSGPHKLLEKIVSYQVLRNCLSLFMQLHRRSSTFLHVKQENKTFLDFNEFKTQKKCEKMFCTIFRSNATSFVGFGMLNPLYKR